MDSGDVTATFQRIETKLDGVVAQSMVAQSRLDGMEKSIERLTVRTERAPTSWTAVLGALVPTFTLILGLAALWYLGPGH